jgi:4-amino-4-deoxy-L-arabinose transferase-like glycosyltransferase
VKSLLGHPARAVWGGEGFERLLLAAAALVIFFAKLWRGPLGGDESCYALLSREILRRGDWLVLHHPAVVAWSNFYEHPPLAMWMTALNFELWGVGDTAAKLFSATCGWLTVAAVYAGARRISGHRFAVVASTVLLTSLYFVDYARKARLEIPLTLFIFLAFVAMLRAVRRDSTAAAVGAGVAMGAGLLTKGVPAAVGLPVAGLVLAVCAPAGTSWRSRAAWAGGFVAGAAVLVLPWAWLQFALDDGRFFDWYTHRQVEWSMAGRGSVEHATSVGFYVKKLFTEVMVPGALLGLAGFLWMLRRRRWRRDAPLYVAAFATMAVVGGFAAIPFHKARYVLPAVPFLALLAAAWFRELGVEGAAHRVSVRLLGILTVAGLILSAVGPVSFTTKKDGDFLPLVRPVQNALGRPDTLLVGGMRRYTAEQVFTWYFDRPLRIELDRTDFVRAWESRRYAAAVYRAKEAPGPPGGTRRAGAYELYLRDASQESATGAK